MTLRCKSIMEKIMVLTCVIGRDSLFDEKSKEELKHIKDIIEGIENMDIQELKKVSDYIHIDMVNWRDEKK